MCGQTDPVNSCECLWGALRMGGKYTGDRPGFSAATFPAIVLERYLAAVLTRERRNIASRKTDFRIVAR
jgi:hypothetical protein